MKKVLKNIVIGIFLLAMTATSAWALVNKDLGFGGKVVFVVSAAGIDIQGTVTHGTEVIDEYEHLSATSDTAANWEIPDITLLKTNATITYSITFINNSEDEDADITITEPTDIPAAFTLSGGVDGTAVDTYTLEAGDEIEFIYTLTLTDFTTSQSLDLLFNVSVVTAVASAG